MNYTIDNHTKREKVQDEDGNPVTKKDANGTSYAVVKETPGFLLRADDALVGFYKTRDEAIAAMQKEKDKPSVLPGQVLSIENHKKREKQFDEDGKPIMENGAVKVKITEGYNLRAGNKVVMFSENRADLVAKIQEVTGISDPKVAEKKAGPQKPEPKREPKQRARR